MARLLVLALALTLGAVSLVSADLPVVEPNGIGAFPPLLPIPALFTNGTAVRNISNTLSFNIVKGANVLVELAAAMGRFATMTFQHRPTVNVAPGVIDTIVFTIVNDTADLQLYVDESYTLSVDATSTNITVLAGTVYGAYHALQSLSQLIGFDFATQQYVIRHSPWAIVDAPRFPHRGMLVDTSRHYLPLQTLKTAIDSLAMAKFNTLHWHIVDAESFPYMSTTYPKLGMQTSWAPEQRFTPNDVSDIVAYAKARGIRVMVELDTPGHSASMCYGNPDICPKPFCPSKNVNNWALDITKNETYTVIQAIITEFNSLFPEKMIHLGGDEVDTYCWSVHQSIVDWLMDRGLSLEGGYEYYVKRIQEFVWSTFPSRQVVGWQEIWDHFGTALNKQTIIQQWLPNSTALPLNVTSNGYRLIWSDSGRWYLDHLTVTWQDMYTAEPCNGLPDENCKLILGGEGCQWGETVDTSDMMQTIWPRAAAIAERLWSPRTTTDWEAALPRMFAFRCLLNSRGISAAPVRNLDARSPPPNPGSCFWQ